MNSPAHLESPSIIRFSGITVWGKPETGRRLRPPPALVSLSVSLGSSSANRMVGSWVSPKTLKTRPSTHNDPSQFLNTRPSATPSETKIRSGEDRELAAVSSSFTFLSVFRPGRQMDALLKSRLMKLLMKEKPAEGLSESSHGR